MEPSLTVGLMPRTRVTHNQTLPEDVTREAAGNSSPGVTVLQRLD